ncbi:hypothetical protein AZE42_06581 [Rhizopogon vesiculosus]|uniref:Uncharacterized protein n=1 Tax=Rhizopogon vesiculosus TaxID=180088 RepID=A0A1J8QSB7_9AGAM|nr:hypothetical protein AZE42_06581 [Rhizopogon vesiculosus]
MHKTPRQSVLLSLLPSRSSHFEFFPSSHHLSLDQKYLALVNLVLIHRSLPDTSSPSYDLFISRCNNMAEAVGCGRAVMQECPPGYSDRSSSLDNLAISLEDRFEQWGVPSDLDEAIDFHRAALALCPPGHSDRSILRDRFK